MIDSLRVCFHNYIFSVPLCLRRLMITVCLFMYVATWGPAFISHNNAYRKTSNISRTLVGNKIVDNSDVVGASPVGAAPTTSSLSTEHLASMDWAKTTARGYKKHLSLGIWCDLYQRFYVCDMIVGVTEYTLIYTKLRSTPLTPQPPPPQKKDREHSN